MTRLSTRAALVAFALVPAALLSSCGDSEPAKTPEKAPAAPADAEPAPPPKPTTSIPAPAPSEPAPATEFAPKAPVKPVVKTPPPPVESSPIGDHLGMVRDAVAALGIDLSDADMAKVSEYVDGAVTKENVAAALKKFGADNPESAVGALAGKLGVDVPGMGGSKDGDDPVAAAKKAARKKLPGITPPRDGRTVQKLSADQLRAERKTTIAQLRATLEVDLADLRAKFAARTKRNPAKAAGHATKLAEKEAELEAASAAKIEATRADYKKRIAAAK